MAAGTCVVACGTAGEETGWVEAFEGALREGGGCAVGGLGEGGEEGGGEEEDGDEEGEMGGEDGHFCFVFFWGWGFLGDDDDVGANVGVDGIAYEVERMCAGCFSLFML